MLAVDIIYVAKKNSGKQFRRVYLNRIIHRYDGRKRPDGITYTAWEKGRASVWDAICVDSLAPSNMAGG